MPAYTRNNNFSTIKCARIRLITMAKFGTLIMSKKKTRPLKREVNNKMLVDGESFSIV